MEKKLVNPTVKDLIEILKDLPQDMLVCVIGPYNNTTIETIKSAAGFIHTNDDYINTDHILIK
jgi:hypothetical protein